MSITSSDSTQSTTQATTTAPSVTTLAMAAGAAGVLALTGCGGSGGGGGSPAPVDYGPANTITSLTLAVAVDAGEAVSIDGAAGAERAANLDGGTHPADPGINGATERYEFAVSTDDGQGGGEALAVGVTINPAATQVLQSTSQAHIDEVKHVLKRVGFTPSWGEVYRFLDKSYEEIVDILLAETGTEAQGGPPSWSARLIPTRDEQRAMSKDEKDELNKWIGRSKNDLKEWWLREMITTSSPLTERMTLFWHNIWTSSFADVRWPQMMYNQNATLRKHCLGSFRELAHVMPEDPAMVRFLDSNTNVKGKPNENFARELVELFSLGEGQDYDEADVPEIARAFTGYGLGDRDQFVFYPEKHDDGVKTIFGRTGHFTGADVVNMILEKFRAAEYVVENVWDEFIGGDRDPVEVHRLATLFYDNDYDLTRLMREVFLSAAFRDQARRGGHIKSPVELIVGTYRALQTEPDKYSTQRWRSSTIGQDLMQPPNVRGWPGGTTWIDAQSFTLRRKYLGSMGWEVRKRMPEDLDDAVVDLLLSVPAVDPLPTDGSVVDLVRAVLKDAAYHLS